MESLVGNQKGLFYCADVIHIIIEENFKMVQVNIVTFIDVDRAFATQTLEGSYYMIDNSIGSIGQGTSHLQTECKPGQILNWIIYAIDSERRPNGIFPPSPIIKNIVFLNTSNEGDEAVGNVKVCDEFKVYGMPDQVRSKHTPVYHYWAGLVGCDLKADVYPYRFVIELEQGGEKLLMSLDGLPKPCLNVKPV